MITNGVFRINWDVHRTQNGAGAIGLAGSFTAADTKDAEQVAQAKNCSIRARIFTPGTFNEKRETKSDCQNDNTSDGNFTAPQVEQGEIWVNVGKHECAGGGSHVDDPGQDDVTNIAQNIIQFFGNEVVETALKNLFTESADPFLHSAEWADPTTKNWAKEDCQEKTNHHQREGCLVDMLDKSAGGGILIDGDHPAKWTKGME